MTAVGIPQEQICAVLKVSVKTLRRHCREQLNSGAAEANAMVVQAMFRMAREFGAA
jgi:hypothetical protein